MTLASGTRLGAYEIVAPIGAGGMGEVYKARDTKLNRTVALKVLPAAVAGDADRLARLRREAQVLASLNHPNIAAIHGFEDSAGVHALVMEFVDGRDLSEMVAVTAGAAPRALSLDDALPIARQIAVALEAAHEQGIVHRDLKPANVKITADGTVKVLDFGLAKALSDSGQSAIGGAADSATVTSPALTQMGVILGTAGYMAPEQAKGKPVDRRADIWAFGIVLFEMLSGRPVYRGETVTETIAQVITQPPPWDVLPTTTPAPIRRLLRRCLEKEPRNRYQSAGDIRVDIDEFLAAPAGEGAPAVAAASAPRWRQILPWAIAAALLVALVVSAWPAAPRPAQTIRLETRLGSGEQLNVDDAFDGALAVLAPDGGSLVYAGTSDGVRRLFVRPLDRLESTALSGTERAFSHFFSPDGRSVGFFAGGALKRILVSGGAPVVLTSTVDPRGGTWGKDDTIVYTPHTSAGLWRVPAGGGTPAEVTRLEAGERTHRWPWFLPDGRTVLFVCQLNTGTYDDGTIEAVQLDKSTRRVLIRGGTFPRYVSSGHLVYTRQGTLFAVPFNPATLEVAGDPKPVFGDIVSAGGSIGSGPGNGASQISIADNGTVAYLSGGPNRSTSQLVITDRSGKPIQTFPDRREFRGPRFSPDGRQLALQMTDGKVENVYVLDRTRGTLTRMTFEGGLSGFPVWSPTGKDLAYFSDRTGQALDVYLMRADGSGDSRALTSGLNRVPGSFSPDGKTILAMEQNPKTGFDLIAISTEDGGITPVLSTPPDEMLPALSPDGKWVAYQSDEAGGQVPDIFVRAYPSGGGKRQVSSGGGGVPFWTKEGRELVYMIGNPPKLRLMAVEVTAQGGSLQLGKPQLLFEASLVLPPNGVPFSVSADGSQFAMLVAEETTTAPKQAHVTIVFNFFEEIRRALER